MGVKYPDSNLRRARYPAAPLVFCLGLSISSLPPPSPNQIPSPTLISSSLPSRFDLVIPVLAYISTIISVTMGRTVDQEVHAAFVEFRAKEDDKVRDCVFRNISNPPQQTSVTNIRDPFWSFLA